MVLGEGVLFSSSQLPIDGLEAGAETPDRAILSPSNSKEYIPSKLPYAFCHSESMGSEYIRVCTIAGSKTA